MSHQAIARKWRPRVFEEISGQRHVTRTLQNAIRLDKVHHAFLLTGARGVGKTSAARILARTLNCERRDELIAQGTANPCNECPSCAEMLGGNFPDVIEFDAASHNSVDDIRDLVEKVRYAPQRGKHKIYIIDEVHMVTKQGFNALLKTLEEPPPHVVFILATTDPQQLLDTVVSRCQRFDFKMIPVRTVYERLAEIAKEEGVGVPDSALVTIAREGGGSMRDAQSLLDQVLSFSGSSVSEDEVAEILGFIDRSILYDVVEAACRNDVAGALEAVGKVRTFGYDVRTFANQLLEAVRNVAITQAVPDASKLLDLPDDELNRLRTLARDRDPTLLQQQFDVLADAVDAIARSEQPELLLDMAAVKMASVRPVVAVDAMVRRLLDLEKRLASGGGGPPGPGGRGRLPDAGAPSTRGPSRAAPPSAAPGPSKVPRATLEAAPSSEANAAPPPPAAPAANATPPASAAPPPAATSPTPAAAPAGPPPPRGKGGTVASRLLGYKRGAGAAAPTAATEPDPTPTAPTAPDPALETPAPDPPRPPPEASRAPAPQPEAAPEASESSPAGHTPVASEQASPRQSDEPASPTDSPAAGAANDEPPGVGVVPPPPASAPSSTAEARRAAQILGLRSTVEADDDVQPLDPQRPDPEGSELCDATRWRRFVHGLRDLDQGPLRAALAGGGYLGVDGQTIRIGFGPTWLVSLRQARELAAAPAFLQALADAFGAEARAEFVADPDGASGRCLAEELDRIRRERKAQLEQEARDHAIVGLTQAVFPGTRVVGVHVPEVQEIQDVG